MKRKFIWAVIIAIIMNSTVLMADDKTADINAGAITFEQFAWLAGHWQGEGLGGRFEEVWMPESGGSMVGTFKLIIDDVVKFYEIMTIRIVDNEPLLSIKHFSSDLTGWEEKDEVVHFDFVDTRPDTLNFDGLSYQKLSDSTMNILLAMKHADGKIDKISLPCRLAE